MRLYQVLAGILIGSTMAKPSSGSKVLFDFTKSSEPTEWSEISDTVREVGMSKAVFSLQRTQLFRRAVFFSLLNPQPNGAGFAGVRKPVDWDLSEYSELRIRCRGQGQNSHYKVVLRHRGQDANDDIEYEQLFDAPMSNSSFADVRLPLGAFKPYYRGREVKDAQPLDLAHITMFGLQVYGGVYLPYKQAGVSALEIETIEARQANETDDAPAK